MRLPEIIADGRLRVHFNQALEAALGKVIANSP